MLHKDYYRRSSAEKKILVVGLKGLDAKTDWLAVNRQSKSNFDILTFCLRWVQLTVGDSHGKLAVEEELEVSLWRLNVWLEDLFTVEVLYISCQETDSEN
jgi:hypothetical protein